MLSRLIGDHKDIYVYLEPLLVDYRKVRIRLPDGGYHISHVDEFVDDCLNLSNMLDIDLPVLPKREALENLNLLTAERISAVEHDVVFENEDPAAVVKGGKSTDSLKVKPFSTMDQQKERRRERLPAFPRDNSYSCSPSRERRPYPRSNVKKRRSLSSSRSSTSRERHKSHRFHSNHENSRRRYDIKSPPPSMHRSSGNRRGHRSRSPLSPTYRSSTRRKDRRSSSLPRETTHRALEKKRNPAFESMAKDELKKRHRMQKKESEKNDTKRKEKSSVKAKNSFTEEESRLHNSKTGKTDDSMSVGEWNKVRSELGLKPLK
ncbi:hypothetical protein IE077_004384 [Cardiosporidium cionae]|uniref:Pre-mRNA-splicing factor 38 n=1 Tax=Cardiosporidium cionae TaxID=476202 RepID=A0ABQ7JG13_9APIC|nr:hypothetical protein IE077_004384 [Cardiosporidium cionae]|eukprot:KAF8822825.1 hypothetical protein IE077_004384 [Cardiosporidium cionae]